MMLPMLNNRIYAVCPVAQVSRPDTENNILCYREITHIPQGKCVTPFNNGRIPIDAKPAARRFEQDSLEQGLVQCYPMYSCLLQLSPSMDASPQSGYPRKH